MIKAIYTKDTLTVLNTSDILKDGKEYLLEIKKPKRTVKQNAYFWVLMTLLARWQGEENTDDFKESLMKHIGHTKTRIDTFTGEEVTESARTSDLNIPDFIELIDKVKMFADKQGINIPDIETYYTNIT